MCVIVHLPKNKQLSKKLLQNCYDNNSHGWGIMAVIDGKIVSVKDISDFETFYQEYQNFPQNVTRALHFRIKTHGKVNKDNCHPFEIIKAGEIIDNEAYALSLMHNGMIDTLETDKNMSDTWHFANLELRPYLLDDVSIFENKKFIKIMEEVTEGSKLLFMDNKDGHARVIKTFPKRWTETNDCFFSNSYSHIERVSTRYTGGAYNGYNSATSLQGYWENGKYHSYYDSDYWDEFDKRYNQKEAAKTAGKSYESTPYKINGVEYTDHYDAFGNYTGRSASIGNSEPVSKASDASCVVTPRYNSVVSDLVPLGKEVPANDDQDFESPNATGRDFLRDDDEETAYQSLKRMITARKDKEPELFPDDESTGEDTDFFGADEIPTVSELMNMSDEDIADWLSENPYGGADLILELIGRGRYTNIA